MPAPLDDRRKRLMYRATHRGTREADRLVGAFAEARVADMDDDALAAFEALLDESDVDLVNWILGRTQPVPQHRAMIDLIINFK